MSNGKCRRALVVDDVVDAADTLGILLKMWGYSVKVCYSGKAALEVAQSYRPHVVLLDIGLPGVDGFQVASGLRRLPALASTLIIGISGHADEVCRARAIATGFDYYLIKPEDPVHLKALLARTVPVSAIVDNRRIEQLKPVGSLLFPKQSSPWSQRTDWVPDNTNTHRTLAVIEAPR